MKKRPLIILMLLLTGCSDGAFRISTENNDKKSQAEQYQDCMNQRGGLKSKSVHDQCIKETQSPNSEW